MPRGHRVSKNVVWVVTSWAIQMPVEINIKGVLLVRLVARRCENRCPPRRGSRPGIHLHRDVDGIGRRNRSDALGATLRPDSPKRLERTAAAGRPAIDVGGQRIGKDGDQLRRVRGRRGGHGVAVADWTGSRRRGRRALVAVGCWRRWSALVGYQDQVNHAYDDPPEECCRDRGYRQGTGYRPEPGPDIATHNRTAMRVISCGR